MVRTKNTSVKTSGQRTNARRFKTQGSDIVRPSKKLVTGPSSARRVDAVDQATHELFEYYNTALIVAIRHDLGDIEDFKLPTERVSVEERSKLATRLINNYAQRYKGKGRSPSYLMHTALEIISGDLSYIIAASVNAVNRKKTGKNAKIPAERALENKTLWKSQFLSYYRKYWPMIKKARIDENGTITTDDPFMCVFFTVFSWWSFGFPVPTKTTAKVEHEGKVIEFPDMIMWSNNLTRTLVLDSNWIPMPSSHCRA